MQSFVVGLEMSDSTMRYEVGKDDSELREMADAMNRISNMYQTSKRELETRKLYYDRILKIMTHEMRNAITPIISLTSDIENKPKKYSGEYLGDTISIIRSQSMEIKRFLDSYYELTHIPIPKKELISMPEFIEKVKAGLTGLVDNPFVENNISFTIAPDASLLIDQGMMTQVVRNMIKNAFEAVEDSIKPSVTVSATNSGDVTLITINDNGPGIPPDIMTNLFQPFTTSKQNGTGIGLFISRQIVRLHEGELIVRNQPGKGVQIQITLPLAAIN